MSRRSLAAAGLLLLLALPRIARLLYPQVWIEDESYLHGAFLLARGYVPYRDFPLPHFPLLEALMAAIFRVAPVSIRTAEIVTQAAAFAASLLVFAIGRRLGGAPTGAWSALIFATSALLFRYHVFEREVFLIVPVLGAFLVLSAAADATHGRRSAIAAGTLLACALAIKLTAVAAAGGIALWLWLGGRRHVAAVTVATVTVILAATALALAAIFGTDFVVQVFVFRLVHATFPSLGVKLDEMRYSMDISFAFGLAGIAFVVWRGEWRRWAGPLLQLASGFLVLVLLNPTYWAHTGIELLPWLSLFAGRLVASVGDAFSSRRRMPALACLAAAALLVVFAAPIRNLNWQAGDGSVYGFGYRSRAEIEAMGAFVRAHAAPDALVATPPLIAFAANRREAVPYAEVAGTVADLTASVRRDGYLSAIRAAAASSESFWDSVEASRDSMAPRTRADLEAHRIAVVIDDSPDDLFPIPMVNLPQPGLERAGYTLEKVSAHYEAWIPRAKK